MGVVKKKKENLIVKYERKRRGEMTEDRSSE
jgi:hypothetical protein